MTVIQTAKRKRKITDDSKMRKIADGIANLNATEKSRLLNLITENIFKGCQMAGPSRDVLEIKVGLSD